MAMTKAEKAEMDTLREARDLARALAWPSYPCPSPMTYDEVRANLTTEIPASYGRGQPRKVCVGWFKSAYNGTVSKGWSDGISHSTTMHPDGSQNKGLIYRTYDDAAHALRHELTIKLARQLADADRLIDLGEPSGKEGG